ncbi:hypothetical protein HMPREF0724_11877 [Prescottella equi ATCC 33707]|uniref:Uncharacterized protein n=1 Tax=Prescottella equi ATCC 33707 TaxID=525370 RepID=F1TJ04_RHOHA|nr:hypothetical protein HMPREF0724_11877 [Prescottella equi ATCC 33707]
MACAAAQFGVAPRSDRHGPAMTGHLRADRNLTLEIIHLSAER